MSELELAEDMADYFSKISSNLTPLSKKSCVPSSEPKIVLTELEVEERLKKCKKPKGLLVGDIFPHLVVKHANAISIPLTRIFNLAFSQEKWPTIWKTEFVTPIPKVTAPTSYNELRNISCTVLFSKILEYFVLRKAKEEIQTRENQFGGLAGSSTNHYLVSAWDKILSSLEGGDQEAVNLISIDFAKAFNTMSHTACISAFKNKNASVHRIGTCGRYGRLFFKN